MFVFHATVMWMPHPRLSRVQCGLSNPAHNSLSPESLRLLLLKSSSFRLEEEELRTVDRALQLCSERLELSRLKEDNTETRQLLFFDHSI